MKSRTDCGSFILLELVLVLFAVSCSGSQYTTQHFSFPPGSKPHESSWKYMALVIVSSKHGAVTDRSEKNVTIRLYDRDKNILMNDEFELVCASVRANIVWEEFKKFAINLIEVGNEFSHDQYNKHLIEHGPKKLLCLTYEYSEKEKKFRRSN